MSWRMTLKEWRALQKPRDQLIVMANTVNTPDLPSQVSYGLGPGFFELDEQVVLAPTPAKRGGVLYVNFDISTDADRRPFTFNRAMCVEVLKHNGFAIAQTTNTIGYWHELQQHEFVASPEGNAVDCYRTYESLMAGCIPIVEKNSMMQLVYGDVPILWTIDYSEITPAFLTAKLAEMSARTYDFSRLLLCGLSQSERELTELRMQYWRDYMARLDRLFARPKVYAPDFEQVKHMLHESEAQPRSLHEGDPWEDKKRLGL